MSDKRGFTPFCPNSNGILLLLVMSTLACCVIQCGTAHHSYYTYGPSIIKNHTVCPKEFYKVVFDAGSTGTRVFIFQFRVGKKGTVIKLNKEHYLSTEPGISSFANNIPGVSEHIQQLLEFAMKKVPQIYHVHTMLSFKATAGLRLLPEDVADKILDEVRFTFKNSSFYIPDLKKIEIMSGGDEGLFGWVTANFLLRKLWKGKKEDTAIAIDLGGGSVQITYGLLPRIDIDSVCSDDVGEVYKMHLLKSSFNIYTHSALGNGLKSAYLNIMGGQEEIESDVEESGEYRTQPQLSLFSPCFVPDFESRWKHGRYIYTVVGEEPEESRLIDCQQRVDEFVRSSKLTNIEEQEREQDVYLFSYFFDVARWAGIIPMDRGSMKITLSDYWAAAEHYCKDEEFSPDRPFLCMSLLYVHSLLSTGFGVSENTSLYVGNEINGKQLSWTLGLALASFNDHLSYSRLCDYS